MGNYGVFMKVCGLYRFESNMFFIVIFMGYFFLFNVCSEGCFEKVYGFFEYNFCWENELRVVYFMLSFCYRYL